MRFSAWANSRSVTAMNLPPFVTQNRELAGQQLFDTTYFSPAESVALSQLRWSMWTIQDKGRFTAPSYHVDMRRPMIGRINDHTKAIETKNGRHAYTSTNLSAQEFTGKFWVRRPSVKAGAASIIGLITTRWVAAKNGR